MKSPYETGLGLHMSITTKKVWPLYPSVSVKEVCHLCLRTRNEGGVDSVVVNSIKGVASVPVSPIEGGVSFGIINPRKGGEGCLNYILNISNDNPELHTDIASNLWSFSIFLPLIMCTSYQYKNNSID